MKIEYEDYKNLIYQLAHRFSKTTGIEFDELVSCANLEFVKCQETFDPIMASFSTYLTIRVKGLFLEMAAKQLRQPYLCSDSLPTRQDKTESAERQLLFKETLQKLSNDAQIIIQLIFNTPTHLINIILEDESRRKQITVSLLANYLQKWGWKWHHILKAFKEIRKALGIKGNKRNRNSLLDAMFIAPNGQPTRFRRKITL